MCQFIMSAADQAGRNGSRFIDASPSAMSSVTSLPSSGANVSPLSVTQRSSFSFAAVCFGIQNRGVASGLDLELRRAHALTKLRTLPARRGGKHCRGKANRVHEAAVTQHFAAAGVTCRYNPFEPSPSKSWRPCLVSSAVAVRTRTSVSRERVDLAMSPPPFRLFFWVNRN